MIKIEKINGEEILVNPDLIEIVEKHGNTIISLTTGNKILAKDSFEDIKTKVIEYYKAIHGNK